MAELFSTKLMWYGRQIALILIFSEAILCRKTFRSKPSTINALKAIVKEFILSIDPDMIRKSCSSARRRFEMVFLEKGG